MISLDRAAEQARTGDLWLFRGRTAADRAIRIGTNSPVNHVGMAIAIEDLPPLLWHAELGRSLPDLWAGERRRGAQLHDLAAAVTLWATRYGQRAWTRQLDPEADPTMEDAALRAVARLDGTPFPSTAALAGRWLRSRSWRSKAAAEDLESAFCAEIVALTYQAMGLLPADRPPGWYDPGRFWSGDELELTGGARLGAEIAVEVAGPGLPAPR